MREDLKPVSWPVPPDIAGMGTEIARDFVEEYLARIEYSSLENERRLKKAFRRIKWCMVLHSMLHPGDAKAIRTRHFSWCPHPYWFQDF